MTCGHECAKQCCGGCGCQTPALVLPVYCSDSDLEEAKRQILAHPGVEQVEADAGQGCLWVWCDDREVALEDLAAILARLGCLPGEQPL